MDTLLQYPEAPARAKSSQYRVLGPGDGLRLFSGPGRDLIFKVTGEDTGGAFDYFIVEVAPKGGPPLHVHHKQEETIHVLKGRYKIRIGDEMFHLTEGGFAYLPSKVPHAFLNLTDEPGEIIVVYTPGGGHKFYEEFGPAARSGPPDPKVLGPLFAKYEMTLLGPPLSPLMNGSYSGLAVKGNLAIAVGQDGPQAVIAVGKR